MPKIFTLLDINKLEISHKTFGMRIAIFGPMASGKSTIAKELGERLNIPIYHLDKLCFLPGTSWEARPADEFQKLHESVISSNEWIIEGNYPNFMPERFARATSIIWMNPPIWRCIFNFYRRFFRKNRKQTSYVGRLDNAKEKFSLKNLKYIFRHKLKRNFFKDLLKDFPENKIFYLNSFGKIKCFCEKIKSL